MDKRTDEIKDLINVIKKAKRVKERVKLTEKANVAIMSFVTIGLIHNSLMVLLNKLIPRRTC